MSLFGRTVELLYLDTARPVELASFWLAYGFGRSVWDAPTVMARDVYSGFDWLPPMWWVAIAFTIAVAQAVAIVGIRRIDAWMRIIANAMCCGFWFVVWGNFYVTDIPTTATNTYFCLFTLTFMMGVFLIWKKNSPT